MSDSSKLPAFKSFDDVRRTILSENPEAAQALKAAEPKIKIALFLSSMRKRKGLSQKEVADRAGLDKSQVSRLESATDKIPDFATVARFAEACGTSVGLIEASVHAEGTLEIVQAAPLEVLITANDLSSQYSAIERLGGASISLPEQEEEVAATMSMG